MGGTGVIIIGSGPAGVSAAWPLVEAGVRVLMLDASDNRTLPVPPPQNMNAEWRRNPDRWRHELGTDGPLASAVRSPKFATPLAQAALSGFADAAGLSTQNYFAVGSLASGGLSRIWGALAAEYSADDLTPWGEARADMAAAYARVKAQAGVSAPPVLTTPIAQMLRAHEKCGDDAAFTLKRASNAVLSSRSGDREACNACGLCLLGCGRGSIYHGAQEVLELSRHRNFTYCTGVRVTRLSGGDGAHVVEGWRDGEAVRFSADAIVLAAGTLMTTKLVLRRLGLTRCPVRLESNPVGGTAFVVPRLIGRALPERSFGLGQLFYTLHPGAEAEAAGVFYGADTLPLSSIADRLPSTRPAALRIARALMPAIVLATGYLPGRFSDNRLTVEEDGAEGRIVIEGNRITESDRLLRRTFKMLAGRVRKLGGWQLPGATHLLEPGSDAHPAATLPMGGNGPAATDLQGELVSLPGLYVADGASLPLLSARHPTLTIMANASRIGQRLAQRMTNRARIATYAP